MRRLLPHVAAAVLACTLIWPSAVRAEEAEEQGRGWYGWQIIAADAAFWGSLFLQYRLGEEGYGAGQELVGLVGGLSYVLTAPILHIRQDNPGSAGWSAGLRLALPTAGLLIG